MQHRIGEEEDQDVPAIESFLKRHATFPYASDARLTPLRHDCRREDTRRDLQRALVSLARHCVGEGSVRRRRRRARRRRRGSEQVRGESAR